MVQIAFAGAARAVTGSCYLVTTDNGKILVDCGLHQGSDESDEQNRDAFPFDPKDIDILLLTHAHIDHSGLIPKLYKSGFHGATVATHATADLCSIMLVDSGYIQESEAEWTNRKRRRAGQPQVEPLYTQRDAQACLSSFRGVDYCEPFELIEGVEARFVDAGHILGSASVELSIRDRRGVVRVAFSGDVGNLNQPIVRDPMSVGPCDFALVESTYGDRDHEDSENRADKLARIIRETLEAGGNIVIPAFAVGRTQDVLYEVHRLQQANKIPRFPIYIDSPLAISATEIFRRHPECFDEDMQHLWSEGQSPFDFEGVSYIRRTEESMALNDVSGAMIISASGMANAGRIKHHLKHNLWRSESTVLFVGFQAVGTLGRSLVDGAKRVKLFGEEVAVNARIESLEGFSAHADRSGLLRWLEHVEGLQKVFAVHGEESQSLALADLASDHLGVDVSVPMLGDVAQLEPGGSVEWVSRATQPVDERVQSIASLLDVIEDRTREVKAMLESAETHSDAARLSELESALRAALAALDRK